MVQLANLDCSNFAIGCGKGDKRGHDQDCDVFSSHVDSDFDYLCYSIIVQLQLNLTFLDPPYPLTVRLGVNTRSISSAETWPSPSPGPAQCAPTALASTLNSL